MFCGTTGLNSHNMQFGDTLLRKYIFQRLPKGKVYGRNKCNRYHNDKIYSKLERKRPPK